MFRLGNNIATTPKQVQVMRKSVPISSKQMIFWYFAELDYSHTNPYEYSRNHQQGS